jgi:hypothetical protein
MHHILEEWFGCYGYSMTSLAPSFVAKAARCSFPLVGGAAGYETMYYCLLGVCMYMIMVCRIWGINVYVWWMSDVYEQ